jgi:hypothetical protein
MTDESQPEPVELAPDAPSDPPDEPMLVEPARPEGADPRLENMIELGEEPPEGGHWIIETDVHGNPVPEDE